MNFQEITNIPCAIRVLDHEYTDITFTLPTPQIHAFVLIFESLSNLMRGIGWKVKNDSVTIRQIHADREPMRQEMLARFEKETISTYKKNLEDGLTPRDSLKLCVAAVKVKFPFSSYDSVKKCLTENKMLRNTGFYRSRHVYN